MHPSAVTATLLTCACISALPSPSEGFSTTRNIGRSPFLLPVSTSAAELRRAKVSLPTSLFASGPSDDGGDETAAAAGGNDDAKVLEEMLREFLASSHREEAHAKFWADDLVYTSSGGSRFDKAALMSTFDGVPDDNGQPPDVIYTPEEIDIRVHGDAAIAAFKLVGATTTDDDGDTLYYYNTGTFLKRRGSWRAVAWHATEIPSQ